MKYTIDFTEVLYYLSQDIEADSEEEAIEKAFKLMDDGEIEVNDSNMDYCISTERKEEQPEEVHKISASLQSYIDGVALNILYQNYHKSTNGIWSKAEVVDHWEEDGDEPEFYEVIVDFGCQDDTRNESYREEIYVYHNGKEWYVNRTIPAQTEKENV